MRNSAFAALGWLVPILVNFLSVPIIVHNLGYDEYGVWALVMAVMGYFALLDLGVAKGGIKFLADANAKNDSASVDQVICIGLLFYCGIGAVGGFFISLSVDPLLLHLIKIPENLQSTARTVFHLASVGFFVTMLQSYLLSLPQAFHRFDVSNTIDSLNQIVSTVITVLVVVTGFGLTGVIVVRILANVVCCISLIRALRKLIPNFHFTTSINLQLARKIFSFSLITFVGRAGNVTANQLQTIVIGSLLGTAAVTVFTIPFTLVSRIMGISNRLSWLIFPVSSEFSGGKETERLYVVYLNMTKNLFFLGLFQVVVLSLFSWEILCVWMGAEFADKASIVLALVAIGYFFNTLTNVPSQVCDGLGFPRITSMFAFIRGAIGIVLTLAGGWLAGLMGVAIGYMASCVVVSAMFNLYIHPRIIKVPYSSVVRECMESALFGALISIVIVTLHHLHPTPFNVFKFSGEMLAITSLFAIFGYYRILDKDHRLRIACSINQAYAQWVAKFKKC